MTKKTFPVLDMSCAACAGSVESMLNSLEAVKQASVSYANQSVFVEYDENKANPQRLQEEVRKIGYDLIIEEETAAEDVAKHEEKRFRTLRSKLIAAYVFTVPVFVISMLIMEKIPYENWILLLLTIPVMFWSGSEFFVNAWKKARHYTANMDTLVALGTGVAFLFSVFTTIYPEFFLRQGFEPHVYYESAAVIIAFILTGRFLEEKAKSRASSAIKKLMSLQPKELTVKRNGQEMRIKLSQVNIGDIIVVKPGEKIPVDGKVSDGSSFVDESMISGEPVPVEKKKDEKVFSGTINQQGSLDIIAEKVGSQTLLAQIIRMVQEAQSDKPPVQKLVDKIAAVFVPVVVSIAIVTFIIWFFFGPEPNLTYAFLTLISVLIIACPCALGLATPTALTVGIGKGAENGILIRNTESLEIAHKADTIVFDKTGTITKGMPEVTDIKWFTGTGEYEQVLLSLERKSEHPLAQAIVKYLKEKKVNEVAIGDFNNQSGKGVSAAYKDNVYYAGNKELIEDNGIKPEAEQQAYFDRLSNEAKTAILFAGEGKILAIIGVADQIHENAVQAIRKLQQMGLELIMLTGDNRQTAEAIAAQAGITKLQANMKPDEKAAYIKELQSAGKKVAMAGDGINDSAALAQADIGIAMARGSDIAMESAGITLMHSDLQHVATAIRLSGKTYKIIRQNLFWAFVYNVLAIPVAAGILYPAFGFLLNPMIAGAAMALSSVSVVTNSLRLKRLKI